MSWQFAATRVTGTVEAIELLESLKSTHGSLAFAGTGPSCEGGEVLCLTRAELLPDADDIRVGEVGGAPVYVDGTRYELWGRPEFLIDVAAGPAPGIGIEGLEDRHFVSHVARGERTSRLSARSSLNFG